MDFEIKHVLKAEPPEVADALLDEEFQASLHDIGPLKERELLFQTARHDGTVERRIRCVLDIEIKGVARSMMGGGDPAWVEEALWHPQRSSWEWTIHPEVGGDLLRAEGSIDLQAHADGTLRVITGMVRVGVPIYGGRVEGWIVDGLEAAYDVEADRLAQWLNGRR